MFIVITCVVEAEFDYQYPILYIKWNLVVRGRRFLCTYSTVL